MIIKLIPGQEGYAETLGISEERHEQIRQACESVVKKHLHSEHTDTSVVFTDFLEIAQTAEELALVSFQCGNFTKFILDKAEREGHDLSQILSAVIN